MKLVWFLAIALLVAGRCFAPRTLFPLPRPASATRSNNRMSRRSSFLSAGAFEQAIPRCPPPPHGQRLAHLLDQSGRCGLATSIKWTLPPGFTAGPIQWPTPEIHKMGPLTTYGYAGDTYLLTTITPPDKLGARMPMDLKAHADWLVCQEECIPGKGDFTLKLTGTEPLAENDARQTFFAAAEKRLPVANTRWDVKSLVAPLGGLTLKNDTRPVLYLELQEKFGKAAGAGKLLFFPEQQNI